MVANAFRLRTGSKSFTAVSPRIASSAGVTPATAGWILLCTLEIRSRSEESSNVEHRYVGIVTRATLRGRRRNSMSGTIQRRADTALTERYEALLRVSQSLISIRSSQELFNVLARELRAVVNFYVMGVGIYDEDAHEVRLTSYQVLAARLPFVFLASTYS